MLLAAVAARTAGGLCSRTALPALSHAASLYRGTHQHRRYATSSREAPASSSSATAAGADATSKAAETAKSATVAEAAVAAAPAQEREATPAAEAAANAHALAAQAAATSSDENEDYGSDAEDLLAMRLRDASVVWHDSSDERHMLKRAVARAMAKEGCNMMPLSELVELVEKEVPGTLFNGYAAFKQVLEEDTTGCFTLFRPKDFDETVVYFDSVLFDPERATIQVYDACSKLWPNDKTDPIHRLKRAAASLLLGTECMSLSELDAQLTQQNRSPATLGIEQSLREVLEADTWRCFKVVDEDEDGSSNGTSVAIDIKQVLLAVREEENIRLSRELDERLAELHSDANDSDSDSTSTSSTSTNSKSDMSLLEAAHKLWPDAEDPAHILKHDAVAFLQKRNGSMPLHRLVSYAGAHLRMQPADAKHVLLDDSSGCFVFTQMLTACLELDKAALLRAARLPMMAMVAHQAVQCARLKRAARWAIQQRFPDPEDPNCLIPRVVGELLLETEDHDMHLDRLFELVRPQLGSIYDLKSAEELDELLNKCGEPFGVYDDGQVRVYLMTKELIELAQDCAKDMEEQQAQLSSSTHPSSYTQIMQAAEAMWPVRADSTVSHLKRTAVGMLLAHPGDADAPHTMPLLAIATAIGAKHGSANAPDFETYPEVYIDSIKRVLLADISGCFSIVSASSNRRRRRGRATPDAGTAQELIQLDSKALLRWAKVEAQIQPAPEAQRYGLQLLRQEHEQLWEQLRGQQRHIQQLMQEVEKLKQQPTKSE